MFITDKYLANYNLKFLSFLLIFCNFALTASCQTKETSVESIIQECQNLLDKDEIIRASECFLKAVLANPSKAKKISKIGQDSLFIKCNEFHTEKDFENAIICFEGLTEFNSGSANIYFLLGSSYFEYSETQLIKDFEVLDRAEKAINKGLDIKPEDAIAYAVLGDILKSKGTLQEALLAYEKAIKISPKNGIFWKKRAFLQEDMNNFNGAIKSYNKALDIDSKDTNALYFLSKVYERLENLDKAIEYIEKMNKLKTPNQKTLQRLKLLKEKNKIEK